jgi:hypothetical protein
VVVVALVVAVVDGVELQAARMRAETAVTASAATPPRRLFRRSDVARTGTAEGRVGIRMKLLSIGTVGDPLGMVHGADDECADRGRQPAVIRFSRSRS